MNSSAYERLVHSSMTFTFAILLLALRTQTALAGTGGIPPIDLFPPCIATGHIHPVFTEVTQIVCTVHNVGITTHNVTIDFRDAGNFTVEVLPSSPLPPGDSTGVAVFPVGAVSCVVTTDEGKLDALSDLSVLMVATPGGGDTAGTIFKTCAASNGAAL